MNEVSVDFAREMVAANLRIGATMAARGWQRRVDALEREASESRK